MLFFSHVIFCASKLESLINLGTLSRNHASSCLSSSFIFLFLGEFSTYGTDVLQMTELTPEKREDPMARVFPKMTKCTFHKFGPSGTVQKFDGLCVLPLNIINEKIYVFLWFWFIVLTVISGLQMLYRMIVIVSPKLREMLLISRSRLTKRHQVESVCRRSQLGDWFMLYQLGKNIDPLIFKEFLGELYKKYENRDHI